MTGTRLRSSGAGDETAEASARADHDVRDRRSEAERDPAGPPGAPGAP
ncbi:hypothetical protein [Streptomyces globisporus]